MDLTVCICTRDRPRYVRDCLDGLARQTVPRSRFATLLVDSASSSVTAADLHELAGQHGARLIRLEQPGVSLARNAGAWAARTPYIAYIDDDAIPAADWVASILHAIGQPGRRPAVIGGRILPQWEAPLPDWWPPSLRGVLSIIEYEGLGEYRTAAVPKGLEPYAANMVVHVLSLLAAGGLAARSAAMVIHCCRTRRCSLRGRCRMRATRCAMTLGSRCITKSRPAGWNPTGCYRGCTGKALRLC